MRYFLLAAVLFTSSAMAQVQVELSIKRRLFIVHEPVLATVSIRNLSGADLELRDDNAQSWFGFEITRTSGMSGVVSAVNPDYRLSPLVIPNGQTVSRTVNVRELYQLQEFGVYNVKAVIYVAQTGRFVTSRPVQIDITDGKVIFRQTVGIPPGTGNAGRERLFTLLSHNLPRGTRLYARIVDPESGRIYCTHSLGRLLSYDTPKVVFDQGNEFHIMQAIAPKSFLYTHLGLDGEVIQRGTYHAVADIPRLQRLADGTVQVVGGVLDVPAAPGAPDAPSAPNISDRPAGLPKP